MTITCAFEQVAPLCAGLVRQGVLFHCVETLSGQWVITLT